MREKRSFQLLLACLLLPIWCSAEADAAPPWSKLLSVNRVEADPDKTYSLREENGPWMIMATSFSGDAAEQQARDLVYELRKRYKLAAYTHRMQFQFGHVQGRGIDQYGTPLRMKHRLSDLEEIAVLVGNYPAVDDPEAQRTLDRLKYARPRCLEVEPDKPTARSLAGFRAIQRYVLAPGSEKKRRGSMGHAFITTNPLLPKGFYAPEGIDPLVLEMNKHVEHSLLDCPGRYTVQVATFKGQALIKPSEIRAIERGKQMKSKLADAAMKAHTLTEALRLKKWEAYEFHDRYASIVTVGSFNSVGTPNANGVIELDPRIHAIMTKFRADPTNRPAPPGTLPTRVKTLLGIPFDPQPILVRVPKRSISSELARGL